jgi:hypothetical protein
MAAKRKVLLCEYHLDCGVEGFFWLIRNDSMFNKQVWSDVKCILRRILKLSLEWRCIYKESKTEEMMRWPSFLEQLIREPLKIRKA